MSTLGWVHFLSCLVALAAGAVVILLRKGTRWHRTWGHLYVWSMAVVLISALSIYDMTGRAGPFHVAAVVGGLTLVAGLYTVLARRPRKSWMEAHAIWMSWSYIGLCAAAAAESLSRFVMPRIAGMLEREALWGAFWASVGLATFVVVGIGWWLVKTRMAGALARTPHSIRADREALGDGGVDVNDRAESGASVG